MSEKRANKQLIESMVKWTRIIEEEKKKQRRIDDNWYNDRAENKNNIKTIINKINQ